MVGGTPCAVEEQFASLRDKSGARAVVTLAPGPPS